jgi:hypothetical protein
MMDARFHGHDILVCYSVAPDVSTCSEPVEGCRTLLRGDSFFVTESARIGWNRKEP